MDLVHEGINTYPPFAPSAAAPQPPVPALMPPAFLMPNSSPEPLPVRDGAEFKAFVPPAPEIIRPPVIIDPELPALMPPAFLMPNSSPIPPPMPAPAFSGSELIKPPALEPEIIQPAVVIKPDNPSESLSPAALEQKPKKEVTQPVTARSLPDKDKKVPVPVSVFPIKFPDPKPDNPVSQVTSTSAPVHSGTEPGTADRGRPAEYPPDEGRAMLREGSDAEPADNRALISIKANHPMQDAYDRRYIKTPILKRLGRRALISTVGTIAAVGVSAFAWSATHQSNDSQIRTTSSLSTTTPHLTQSQSKKAELAEIVSLAAPPQLVYEYLPGLTSTQIVTIQKELGMAREIESSMSPVIKEAAEDPRSGDLNGIPGHDDIRILQFELLFPNAGNPTSPTGIIPIPQQEFGRLVREMNATGSKELPKPQDLTTNEETVPLVDVMAEIRKINDNYHQWSTNNPGASLRDFEVWDLNESTGGSSMAVQAEVNALDELGNRSDVDYEQVLIDNLNNSTSYYSHLASTAQKLDPLGINQGQ